jgi:hypothetical protein
VRSGAAAAEARRYAQGALAHAEKLRQEANAAFDAGDQAGSELLGERAIAAYAHAEALARIARAEAGADEAAAKEKAAKGDLEGIDAEQTRIAADADALELRVKVVRDAQPIEPSGKADPEREQARAAAARSLAVQARLLCTAAKLLASGGQGAAASAGEAGKAAAPDPKPLDEATAALAKVEADLGLGEGGKPAPGPAPIDAATRARAGCLSALTGIRRAATPVSRAPGVGDALLSEISAMGTLSPSRDDRGVFVTLRGLFGGGKGGAGGLTPAAETKLGELGRIAAAHPAFPVEVVLHHDRPVPAKDAPAERARAEAVAKALGAAARGVRVESIDAGNGAPVVDPAGADRARNARVEIVFVTPETF